ALGAGALATARQTERFRREVRLASRLRHPGVVTLYEAGETPGGVPYFAMEWVDGVELTEHVDQTFARPQPDRVPLLALFLKICRAVEAAHQHGVVHRDLKPSNVLVDGSGEPRVVDFGLAKSMGGHGLGSGVTRAGEFLGSLGWASPEQIEGKDDLDERTDVHGLGLLFYFLMSGKLPYRSENLGALVEDAARSRPPQLRGPFSDALSAPALDKVVVRATDREPQRRYPTVAALIADVERVRDGVPLPGSDTAKPRKRLRVVLAAAVALLVPLPGRDTAKRRKVLRIAFAAAVPFLLLGAWAAFGSIYGPGLRVAAVRARLDADEVFDAEDALWRAVTSDRDRIPAEGVLWEGATDPLLWAARELYSRTLWRGVRDTEGHINMVFDRDAKHAVTWGYDDSSPRIAEVDVWKLPELEHVQRFQVPGLWQARPSPDGLWLVTLDEEGTVLRWELDAPTNEPRRVASAPQVYSGVGFSEEELLVVATSVGEFTLFDLATLEPRRTVVCEFAGEVTGVVREWYYRLSPDGRWLVAPLANFQPGGFELVDLTGAQEARKVLTSGSMVVGRNSILIGTREVLSLPDLKRVEGAKEALEGAGRAAAPVGPQSFAVSLPSGDVRVVGGRPFTRGEDLHAAREMVVLLSAARSLIGALSREGRLRVLSRHRGTWVHSLDREGQWSDVRVSEDGRTVAFAGANARIWLYRDGDRLRETGFDGLDLGLLTGLDLAPNGERVAIATGTGQVYLGRPGGGFGRPLLTCQKAVSLVRFSPDGTRLAAVSDEGDLYLLDAEEGAVLWERGLSDQRIGTVAWSPDGEVLACGGHDRFAWVTRRTGEVRAAEHPAKRTITSVDFDASGARCAAVSADGWLLVFRPGAARPEVAYQLGGYLLSLAFHNELLLIGDTAGQVTAWDAGRDRLLGRISTGLKYAMGLDISPDGRLVYVAGQAPPSVLSLDELDKIVESHAPRRDSP
ncbi:MAG: protein kinase, partial [Planctomycetota bacterium]